MEILKFTEKSYNIKKIELESIQNELAIFVDKNQVISSSIFSNQLRILESKYNIANGIFLELSKQLEQARLKVSKDTPVFVTIQSPSIPNYRSSPQRTMIVLAWSFIGMVFAIIYILFINDIRILIKRIISNN